MMKWYFRLVKMNANTYLYAWNYYIQVSGTTLAMNGVTHCKKLRGNISFFYNIACTFATEEGAEENTPTHADLGLLDLHSCSSNILLVSLSPGRAWHHQEADVSSHTNLLYSPIVELMNLCMWKGNAEA